jgi:hypothetical protein
MKIPNTNEIEQFFHCRRCLADKPADVSPREWVRLEAGFTLIGLQVWCVRCERNVVHMDFEGKRHPANVTCVDDDPIRET